MGVKRSVRLMPPAIVLSEVPAKSRLSPTFAKSLIFTEDSIQKVSVKGFFAKTFDLDLASILRRKVSLDRCVISSDTLTGRARTVHT